MTHCAHFVTKFGAERASGWCAASEASDCKLSRNAPEARGSSRRRWSASARPLLATLGISTREAVVSFPVSFGRHRPRSAGFAFDSPQRGRCSVNRRERAQEQTSKARVLQAASWAQSRVSFSRRMTEFLGRAQGTSVRSQTDDVGCQSSEPGPEQTLDGSIMRLSGSIPHADQQPTMLARRRRGRLAIGGELAELSQAAPMGLTCAGEQPRVRSSYSRVAAPRLRQPAS